MLQLDLTFGFNEFTVGLPNQGAENVLDLHLPAAFNFISYNFTLMLIFFIFLPITKFLG